jgi:hypothetical protein
LSAAINTNAALAGCTLEQPALQELQIGGTERLDRFTFR